MFSLSKHRILKEHLKFKQGRFPRCNWRLKDAGLGFLSECVTKILKDTGNPSVEGIEILKLVRKKGVYRVPDPVNSDRSFIVKIFLLRHLSHRLSAHLYGLDEAANFITASNRGIKTPELVGFGQYHARSGLVKVSAVVTQDLRGYITVRELLQKSDETNHDRILAKILPVFRSLYHSNCNHIDVNSNAIMLSEDESSDEVYLLDFQHAQFYDTPSLNILMFETGLFAKTCEGLVSQETIIRWINKLLDIIGISNEEKVKAWELFADYCRGDGNDLARVNISRKRRKKIR